MTIQNQETITTRQWYATDVPPVCFLICLALAAISTLLELETLKAIAINAIPFCLVIWPLLILATRHPRKAAGLSQLLNILCVLGLTFVPLLIAAAS